MLPAGLVLLSASGRRVLLLSKDGGGYRYEAIDDRSPKVCPVRSSLGQPLSAVLLPDGVSLVSVESVGGVERLLLYSGARPPRALTGWSAGRRYSALRTIAADRSRALLQADEGGLRYMLWVDLRSDKVASPRWTVEGALGAWSDGTAAAFVRASPSPEIAVGAFRGARSTRSDSIGEIDGDLAQATTGPLGWALVLTPSGDGWSLFGYPRAGGHSERLANYSGYSPDRQPLLAYSSALGELAVGTVGGRVVLLSISVASGKGHLSDRRRP